MNWNGREIIKYSHVKNSMLGRPTGPEIVDVRRIYTFHLCLEMGNPISVSNWIIPSSRVQNAIENGIEIEYLAFTCLGCASTYIKKDI